MRYLWIWSCDPFGSPDAADDVAMLERLAASGAAVEVVLVQNAVLAARSGAADTGLERLARAGVAVAADAFSLRERGIAAAELRAGVTPCGLDVVIAAMAAGDRVGWL